MQSIEASDRQRHLLALLRQKGRIPVRELIAASKSSPATVRRDLNELESTGQVVRVHGGVLLPEAVSGEIPHKHRKAENIEAKRAIARSAAFWIPENASVFLDAGTTCHELGAALLLRSDITIYTTSGSLLPLAHRARARLIFLGGEFRSISLALVGAVTLEWLGRLHPDFCFLGASALHASEGLFNTEISEASVKRQAIGRARCRVLLADSSKLNATAAVQFAGWSEIDHWFTDSAVPESAVEAIPSRIIRC